MLIHQQIIELGKFQHITAGSRGKAPALGAEAPRISLGSDLRRAEEGVQSRRSGAVTGESLPSSSPIGPARAPGAAPGLHNRLAIA